MDEIVIRTSEMEPSVHQIALPTATDLLLCARVCSLLEGYDRLLRHQAAKGRRWFDFAELVGAERHELEEAYLCALGHRKEADEQAKRQAIAGSIARMGASASIQVPSVGSGNPFGAGASASTTMEEVSLLGDTVAEEASRFGDPKNLPHPSILKSLLDCGDDIKVEGYFTETLGEEDEGLSIPALEHGERTIFPEDYGEKSSAVTVAIFSSQKHRQFLVCYKGTAEQQAKPVKSHVRQKDANGGENISFSSSFRKMHPSHCCIALLSFIHFFHTLTHRHNPLNFFALFNRTERPPPDACSPCEPDVPRLLLHQRTREEGIYAPRQFDVGQPLLRRCILWSFLRWCPQYNRRDAIFGPLPHDDGALPYLRNPQGRRYDLPSLCQLLA
jgi:hypothetical protein